MILQPSSLHRHILFSPARSYPYSSPPRFRGVTLFPPFPRNDSTVISCSISNISRGIRDTLDYERRPMVKWNDVFKRISFMENPEMGSASVLDQWESEGKRLTKWELCRVIKELRKFRKFKLALEVYEWMSNRIRIYCSDAAIQLDLIAKVRGIRYAEDFFTALPDNLKDGKTYGALLNVYSRARMQENAESVLDRMKKKGFVTSALSFNVMMTMYMKMQEFDKVDSMILEMNQNNLPLDLYSYNIWISSSGFQGSVEKMEQCYEKMVSDRTASPNWTTFTTMATVYIKYGRFRNAEECLKKAEAKIWGRARNPYHYLFSLYASIGKKEEVYRLWDIFKLTFSSIPTASYFSVISSLARLGEIESVERLYKEWLGVRKHYDPRIGTVLVSWYGRQGFLDKAEEFFEHMTQVGGQPPVSVTWEALAEGHIHHGSISEALNCLNEAFAAASSQNWKPKIGTVSELYRRCATEGDFGSMDSLKEMLRSRGFLEIKSYASIFGLVSNEITASGDDVENEDVDANDDDDDGVEMLLNQF